MRAGARDCRDRAIRRDQPDRCAGRLRHVEVAGGVHGDMPGIVDSGNGRDGAAFRYLADPISVGFGDEEVSSRVHGHAERTGQAGTGCGSPVARSSPASVVMMPLASTFRMREVPKTESATKRFPTVSTAMAVGESSACVAGTPSPTLEPPPATVEMMPPGVTLRTNLPAAM